MEDQYITIKEFADRAGVSVQSVYRRLNRFNNPLNLYVKQVDNQKMLNIRALQEIYGVGVVKPFKPFDSTFSTPDSTPKEVENILIKQVEMLQEELKQKNKQINDLNERLSEYNRLLDQAQQLHALEKKRVQELEDRQRKEETEIDQPVIKKWWEFWK